MDLRRTLVPVLTVVAILLLLGGTLCLLDDDGAHVDLCLVAVLLAVGPLVALALEPSGRLAPVGVTGCALPPPDLHSPPPKGSLALA